MLFLAVCGIFYHVWEISHTIYNNWQLPYRAEPRPGVSADALSVRPAAGGGGLVRGVRDARAVVDAALDDPAETLVHAAAAEAVVGLAADRGADLARFESD